MKRILIAGAVAAGLLGLAAPSAQAAPVGKPDALIKRPGLNFVGNDIYNDDGDDQTACAVGSDLTFVIRFQNDGKGKDRYTLFAFPDNEPGVTSTLTFKGDDITDEVTAQTFKLPKVKKGKKTKPVKLEVSITGSPPVASDTIIGARSKHNLVADVVKAVYNSSGFCTA